ncbi:ion transporter [Rathayibacter rathayi]|uniref:Ion transporter n=1 Tax=Rathayibacter rathayi TaxID=33887 RepID=A0ABX5AFT1_RATRA|nr:ion transporter [Rathayibacter rathayi]MWV73135.1 ion transporter [Rathayibacter rathayi NCPPB 2980 = VKM Ac-1601]PPF51811.1 ion transporter [Rathayibacter rathayi]PPF83416.1 ion transporter [Rathayibacter rathayi]PPG16317.1 ion transporter [Rathayibacter rathayi]
MGSVTPRRPAELYGVRSRIPKRDRLLHPAPGSSHHAGPVDVYGHRVQQKRWQEITEWPLTVAAVIFLVAYAWEVLGHLTGATAAIADAVINATWVLFVLDYLIKLFLAERRGRWFVTHLFDVTVVALPILRPLRLLRLVTLVSILQRRAGAAFRGRVILFAASSTALLLFVASLAVLDAERDADGTLITTFHQALWWAFVTITTVGYGDLYPVTGTGRFIAAGIMLGGIALIGVVTATLASYIVERVTQHDENTDKRIQEQVRELSDQIRQLREELRERDATRLPRTEHGTTTPDTGSPGIGRDPSDATSSRHEAQR